MKNLRLFVFCFMLIIAAQSNATIINVPGDTTSIKGGIALANTGDTVLVAPGIYYEHDIYLTKDITVASYFLTTGDTTYIDSTIVDGSAQSVVFTVDRVLLISGFTIRNGLSNYGGGIWVMGEDDDYPIIENNIITGNHSTAHSKDEEGGGGILTWLGHTTIRNNKIIGNSSGLTGGGICVGYQGQATIYDNIISNDSANTDGGGICVAYRGQATIYDNIISNNSATTDGGGIATDVSGLGATIIGNTISHNVAGNGGGISCQDTLGSVIQNNLISDNSINGYGGGIYCANDANPTIKENTVMGNLAFIGSAIECESNSNPEITNNIIKDHSATVTIELFSCSALLKNNTFYNNSSSTILDCNNCTATIINNLLVSNSNTAISSSNSSNLTISNNDFYDQQGTLFSGSMPSGIGVISQTNANSDSCDAYTNLFLDPLLADTANGDFQITWANWPVADSTRSPSIDAGDPVSPKDADSTIADIGALYFNQMHPFISTPDSLLDFGKVIIGESADMVLTLFNSGKDTLEITAISNNLSVFSNNWTSGNSQILPGDSLDITITFAPADSNLVLDTLHIENNDRPLEVHLSGSGETPVGIINQEELPEMYTLYPAYPNPFNSSTTFEFDLPRKSFVILIVYNNLGEQISTLISKELMAGKHKFIWNPGNLVNGIYFYRLKAGGSNKIGEISLVR